jgi:hypothetical protein
MATSNNCAKPISVIGCAWVIRILFDVEDDTIVIQKIGNRKDVYE